MKWILCLLLLAPFAAHGETLTLSGWTVHVSDALEKKPLGKALVLLQGQLDEIVRVVPAKAVVELRKVPLWISPEYPNTPPRAEYHPNVNWLREHGRNPEMAKGIEFTNVRIFEAECKRMPNFALHELAHAYHDLVLGYENADVKAAFQKATVAGTYEKVERRDAKGLKSLARAYAMTNEKEYFAECTEAYFSRNDFYPFTREELTAHDPQICRVLEKVWGVVEP